MEIEEFEITEKHLELIRRMYVEYNSHTEFGSPKIDPKRPYGNSDVYADIAEILGWEFAESEQDFTDEQLELMDRLHKGTATALQIILQRGEFETGRFRKEDKYDDRSWYKIES